MRGDAFDGGVEAAEYVMSNQQLLPHLNPLPTVQGEPPRVSWRLGLLSGSRVIFTWHIRSIENVYVVRCSWIPESVESWRKNVADALLDMTSRDR